MGEVSNILLTIFGVLFAIIGWLAKDKLSSIKDSLDLLRKDFSKLSSEIQAEHDSNILQDQRIERLEELHPITPLTLQKGT